MPAVRQPCGFRRFRRGRRTGPGRGARTAASTAHAASAGAAARARRLVAHLLGHTIPALQSSRRRSAGRGRRCGGLGYRKSHASRQRRRRDQSNSGHTHSAYPSSLQMAPASPRRDVGGTESARVRSLSAACQKRIRRFASAAPVNCPGAETNLSGSAHPADQCRQRIGESQQQVGGPWTPRG
jgi:hypothetical protein